MQTQQKKTAHNMITNAFVNKQQQTDYTPTQYAQM